MSSLTAVWRSPWLAPLNDVTALNDLLAQANPLWSLDQVKARVIQVVHETADTRTFVLRANRHWQGHRAGQHVVLEVEVNGVRRHRSFSIASAADGSRRLSLTVKRQAQGTVTRWMHDHLQVGAVVGLSAPHGDFVLPAPQKLVMVAAGSGITPLMSMLRTLDGAGQHRDVALLYVSRTPEDTIFAAELEQLSRRWPGLQLRFWHTARSGRLDARALDAAVPDAAERLALICGPQDFMQMLQEHWQHNGWVAPLQENFGVPVRYGDAGSAQTVHALKSEQMFTAQPGMSLLQQAEAAGLTPKHGCRIGICQTCKCVKRSGAVRNLLTGAVSAEPNEQIQLCISGAVSELTLEL